MKLSDNGENKKSSTNAGNPASVERVARVVRDGPKTLEAKWLDPECWDGCMSLVFKGRLEKAVMELRNIANADMRLWAGFDTPDEFMKWAQSRAAFTLKAITEERDLSENADNSQGVRVEAESQSLPSDVGVQVQERA